MDKKQNGFYANRAMYRPESVAIASLLLEFGGWNAVKERVLSTNLLQSRTISNGERLYRELTSRLKTLSERELSLLVHGTAQDQGYILWIAICRRYELIASFADEVLRERHHGLKTDVRHEDFDAFYNRRADWQPKLDTIQPSTRAKLRQILFKILREAQLIDSNYKILPALLSQRLIDAVCEKGNSSIRWFPVHERDLTGITR